MTSEPTPQKLRALPVQLIETSDGVILKRGCVEIKIAGESAAEAIQIVLNAAGDGGATEEEICQIFAAPDRATVANLIKQLVSRRILVPADMLSDADLETSESSIEVFYWHFGIQPHQAKKHLRGQRMAIMGVNCISRQLASSLAATAVENVEVVDYPLLRNLRMFDEDNKLAVNQWPDHLKPHLDYETWLNDLRPETLGCVVATSDFGGQQLMREWNSFCLEHKCTFLPVVLQDFIGYVGPLIVPGETACYECLRARQNSNMKDPAAQRAAEYVAFEGQEVTGFHPSMASVLGGIAAIELMKFYTTGPPLWRAGALIEVNLLATQLSVRKVLKMPRCRACSALNTQASTSLVKNYFLPAQTVTP